MKDKANYIPDLLFIQSILKGHFKDNVLTFEQSSPLLLFFGERPSRISGHLTVHAFLELWDNGKDSFKNIPPNAALSILTHDAVTNAIVELFSPAFRNGVFTYQIKVLSGAIPHRFHAASLFIDAFPTSVNDQITDAITQTNVKVLGDAPAMAMGNLFQATAQALSNAAHQATDSQQQSSVTAQAATTLGVATLYSIDTASTGEAIKAILD